jgi:hypothetical protein
MEKEIEAVQPIKKISGIRGIRPIQLHHGPGYRPKQKAKRTANNKQEEKNEQETSAVNHAHHTPEGLGEHIDFKT